MSSAYVLEPHLKGYAPGRILTTYLEGCSPAHPVLHDIYFFLGTWRTYLLSPGHTLRLLQDRGGGVLDNVLEYICPGEHVVQIHRAKHKVRPGDGLNLCRLYTCWTYVVENTKVCPGPHWTYVVDIQRIHTSSRYVLEKRFTWSAFWGCIPTTYAQSVSQGCIFIMSSVYVVGIRPGLHPFKWSSRTYIEDIIVRRNLRMYVNDVNQGCTSRRKSRTYLKNVLWGRISRILPKDIYSGRTYNVINFMWSTTVSYSNTGWHICK